MAADQVERRLAAILAADVAGYSRLMGTDEEGTLARLTAHRRELFDPMIAKHRGRIVKSTGDGLLAEFASVVDAVRCAAEVQVGMAKRNAAATAPRIDFRIGINVGDIIQQEGDVFGDGVNIAARLEGIAEPGGICVSARVQEDTGGKTDLAFEDMGEQTLKNIVRPVRAYRVRTEAAAGSSPGRETRPAADQKPALAVLPFQNMSGDTEQEYFSDGVVEDIITALSRFKSFAVIARNSSFVYKGKAVDVRQVGKDLGVRYVLEGSVRRSGGRLRITAQLIDAASGAHLWARKFDGAVENVFDVQDRITESVATIVEPQIREAEIERSRREQPGSLAAYDLYLHALSQFRIGRPSENATASELLTRAIALEPNNATLLAQAANVLQHRYSMGWPALTADDRAQCRDLVGRALASARDDATVLAKCGNVLLQVSREYDFGFATLKRAVELNPNNVEVLTNTGIAAMHVGEPNDARAYFGRVLDLSPNDPFAFVPLAGIAIIDIMQGHYAEAVATAERALAAHASFDPAYWALIAGNALLGRTDEARKWVAALRALVPGITIGRIRSGQPGKYPERLAPMWEGMRLAGLPED